MGDSMARRSLALPIHYGTQAFLPVRPAPNVFGAVTDSAQSTPLGAQV